MADRPAVNPEPNAITVEIVAGAAELQVKLTPPNSEQSADEEQDGDVRRRQFIELSSKLANGLLAWQVLGADRIERLLRTLGPAVHLDDQAVEDSAAVASIWHRSYWTIPAATLLPKVEGQLAIVEQLRSVANTDAHRTHLAVIEAGLARLAGVINAQDRQDRTSARGYYHRALELADATDHHQLAAYALGGMSFLNAYGSNSNPRAALRLAARAAGRADRTQLFSLRSWVALLTAHAHAGLGHSTECISALGQAQDWYDKGRRPDEPPWMGFLSDAFIRSDEGACLVKLGRGRQAVAVLDQALGELPTSSLKLRSVILANRASALGLSGDLDSACGSASESLAIATQIDYVRVVKRIREFSDALDPRLQSSPVAQALREQLAML